jgi:hypothetical protein
MVTELAIAGLFIAYGDLTVTLAPAAMITSSAKVGTTPPTHVPGRLHSPPAPVLLICATDRLHMKINAVINALLPTDDKLNLELPICLLRRESKSVLMSKNLLVQVIRMKCLSKIAD